MWSALLHRAYTQMTQYGLFVALCVACVLTVRKSADTFTAGMKLTPEDEQGP